PAEDLGPKELQSNINQLAKTFSARVTIHEGEELIEQGYPLVHAVGRASDRKPCVADLTWGDPSHRSLTLIGKGVCFDTGGLDLKSALGMRHMKKDMAGAANMIGLANLIMGMNLPVHLRLMIPIVDNNLSGNSYRPGDIFTARNGKTVEIGNTDAEGRLILADVLAAACEAKPDLIVDFATLTGNRALGSVVSCFSHDVKMTQKIQDCGLKCEDQVWSMPLIKQYTSLFDSDVADLVNITNLVMDCGTATAAMFLNEFVDKDVSWVHCDTLGYNPRSMPGRPKGGEALGLRAFYHFISNWCQA
ncbi:MAG: leucyl aminopeptidase, partial [Legionellales bacterium]|nr:leucyl aminopeptidase [Legionellales bacterium]